MSATEAASGSGSTAVRPFEVAFSDEELSDLRGRINATRWPERETVADDSQGVPLATVQKLAPDEAVHVDDDHRGHRRSV